MERPEGRRVVREVALDHAAQALGSLAAATYAEIVAYVLDVNGVPPSQVDLPADATQLSRWRLP